MAFPALVVRVCVCAWGPWKVSFGTAERSLCAVSESLWTRRRQPFVWMYPFVVL